MVEISKMSYLAFEICEIPDLTLVKYQSLAENGVGGALSKHDVFLRQWHGICLELNLSMHLLYLFDINAQQGYRLRSFFILQGEGEPLSAAELLVNNGPLSPYFAFTKTSIPDARFATGATLTKSERVDTIFNPLSGETKQVHYVPSWTVNNDSRLIELFKTLQTFGTIQHEGRGEYGSCAFRVDLYPVQESEGVRSVFGPLVKSLKGEFDIKLTDDSRGTKQDSHVSEICKVYEDWLTVLETTPHFRINTYSFAPMQFQAKLLLNSVGSEIVEEGNYSITPIKQDDNEGFSCLSRMQAGPQTYCVHKEVSILDEWPTTFSLNEATPFFRFPVLYDGETIELPKETVAPKQEQGIVFGRDSNGYNVLFPLGKLSRHAFFTGMPGSGKTNTMLHLATSLHSAGIPFLALEPAKKEYRNLLMLPEMSGIYLFSPHIQSSFPLQVNPLEFPVGVRLSEHINALLEVFRGSFLLEGPTFKFLSSAILAAYENNGWTLEDINDGTDDHAFPTLKDVYANVETEVECSSYDAEIKGNVRSFLQVRLGGLMDRDAGELFDATISTIRPDEWLTKTAIVELEVLDEQSKNFFILLLCQYISETIRANPKGSPEMPVRHALFIEEAHNIIASDSQQGSSETVDPKVASTAYIVKMLAEMRALREAIIISDQLPTTLATEVTKNTGLKLVHRLASKDDRELIGSSISATSAQVEEMGDLDTGNAFIHYEGVKKPFTVKVEEWKSPDCGLDISNDIELARRLRDSNELKKATLRSIQNWAEKCITTISTQINHYLSRQDRMDRAPSDKIEEFERKQELRDAISKVRASYSKRKPLWQVDDENIASEQAYIENMLEAFEQQVDLN